MKIVARAFLRSTVLKFSVRNHRAALMGLMRAVMIFFIFPSWSVFWTFSHQISNIFKMFKLLLFRFNDFCSI